MRPATSHRPLTGSRADWPARRVTCFVRRRSSCGSKKAETGRIASLLRLTGHAKWGARPFRCRLSWPLATSSFLPFIHVNADDDDGSLSLGLSTTTTSDGEEANPHRRRAPPRPRMPVSCLHRVLDRREAALCCLDAWHPLNQHKRPRSAPAPAALSLRALVLIEPNTRPGKPAAHSGAVRHEAADSHASTHKQPQTGGERCAPAPDFHILCGLPALDEPAHTPSPCGVPPARRARCSCVWPACQGIRV